MRIVTTALAVGLMAPATLGGTAAAQSPKAEASKIEAAEIKVLATATVTGVLRALQPEFERSSGHRLAITSATAGRVRDRLMAHEPADVAFVTASVIAEVEKAGLLVAGSRVEMARSPLGVAIAKGAAKPDLATVDAVKNLILSAKTVALTDPNGGGNTGRFFMAQADKLGVGPQLAAKTKLYHDGGEVSAAVARGEADFGITVISEIVPIAGADVGGALPDAMQNVSITYAALVVGGEHAQAGKALIEYLTSAAALAEIRGHGMEPGRR